MTGQPYVLFGDFEAAIIDILSNASELDPYNIDHITSDLNQYESGMTYVTVEMQGGSYKFYVVKRPRIDITVYAAKRSLAYDISTTAQAVIFAKQGDYKGHGVNLCACQIETDIFKAYEKDTDQVRYIQSLRLICKPWPQP